MYSVYSSGQIDVNGTLNEDITKRNMLRREREKESKVNWKVLALIFSYPVIGLYRSNKLSTEFLQEPFDLNKRSPCHFSVHIF